MVDEIAIEQAIHPACAAKEHHSCPKMIESKYLLDRIIYRKIFHCACICHMADE